MLGQNLRWGFSPICHASPFQILSIFVLLSAANLKPRGPPLLPPPLLISSLAADESLALPPSSVAHPANPQIRRRYKSLASQPTCTTSPALQIPYGRHSPLHSPVGLSGTRWSSRRPHPVTSYTRTSSDSIPMYQSRS